MTKKKRVKTTYTTVLSTYIIIAITYITIGFLIGAVVYKEEKQFDINGIQAINFLEEKKLFSEDKELTITINQTNFNLKSIKAFLFKEEDGIIGRTGVYYPDEQFYCVDMEDRTNR